MNTRFIVDDTCIDDITDFNNYKIASKYEFITSNLYFDIVRLKNIYIKRPNKYAFEKFSTYFVFSDFDESEEGKIHLKYVNKFKLDCKHYNLKNANSIRNSFYKFFFLVHLAQYQRICDQRFCHIVGDKNKPIWEQLHFTSVPKAKFIMLKQGIMGFNTPAIVQEKILGTTLWDMFDHERKTVKLEFTDSKSAISEGLGRFLSSDDIDYNPKNFIFSDGIIYYVDSKPGIYARSEINSTNERLLIKHFCTS